MDQAPGTFQYMGGDGGWYDNPTQGWSSSYKQGYAPTDVMAADGYNAQQMQAYYAQPKEKIYNTGGWNLAGADLTNWANGGKPVGGGSGFSMVGGNAPTPNYSNSPITGNQNNSIRNAFSDLNFGGDNIPYSAYQAQQRMTQNGWTVDQVAQAYGYTPDQIRAVLAKGQGYNPNGPTYPSSPAPYPNPSPNRYNQYGAVTYLNSPVTGSNGPTYPSYLAPY
jgi:hypothetical protein